MTTDLKNIVNLDLKKDDKILNFSDLFLILNLQCFLSQLSSVIVIYIFVIYICIIHLSHNTLNKA